MNMANYIIGLLRPNGRVTVIEGNGMSLEEICKRFVAPDMPEIERPNLHIFKLVPMEKSVERVERTLDVLEVTVLGEANDLPYVPREPK